MSFKYFAEVAKLKRIKIQQIGLEGLGYSKYGHTVKVRLGGVEKGKTAPKVKPGEGYTELLSALWGGDVECLHHRSHVGKAEMLQKQHMRALGAKKNARGVLKGLGLGYDDEETQDRHHNNRGNERDAEGKFGATGVFFDEDDSGDGDNEDDGEVDGKSSTRALQGKKSRKKNFKQGLLFAEDEDVIAMNKRNRNLAANGGAVVEPGENRGNDDDVRQRLIFGGSGMDEKHSEK